MSEPIQITTPDGRSLDVFVAGPADGDVLLFHHGSPGVGAPSAKLVAAAAERGLRYVAITRPGYAGSTRRPGRRVADVVDDAAAVLDHLEAKRCFTMGWSGGGPHTLACAALLPERVVAAVAVASVAPYPAEDLDWTAGMGQENIEEFAAALAGTEALRAFQEPSASGLRAVTADQVADSLGDLVPPVDRAALTGELAEELADDLRRALTDGIWGWHDDDLAFTRPWGFDLADIQVPTAIWQGTDDRMVPFAHGQWLAGRIPGVRAHLLPDHGHLSLAVASLPAILDDLRSLARPVAGTSA
ncbi:MAG TPA: alpha/beta hydrolase [Candidatus Limnocylindrales bacterium]|nr:alpha/beta hydrolase [Candidatus Limnocylindrales bacterium]